MIKKGQEKTMSKHRLRRWARGEGGLEKENEREMAGKNLRREQTRGLMKGIC